MVKEILVQLMEHYNSIRWVDYVEQALEIYNTRVHTSIGMSPEAAVEKKNQKIILRKYLKRYANYDKKRVEKNRRKPRRKPRTLPRMQRNPRTIFRKMQNGQPTILRRNQSELLMLPIRMRVKTSRL